MKEDTTTFGLSPAKLRSLFNIGKETKKPHRNAGTNRDKADVLRSWLAQPLPLDKSQIEMLPAVLGRLCHTIGLLADETIATLLRDPSTDIALIERVKQYGKRSSTRAKSETEYEVATAIYYAAIAHALAFHGSRITSFSYKRLQTAFCRLTRESWISDELSILFKVAAKYCRDKAK